MEPRARAGRHKVNLNFGPELSALLYAYGAPTHPDIAKPIGAASRQYLSAQNTPNITHPPTPFTQPFPETLRVLDEILTDFIIETCHNAVGVSVYSGRAKLKVSDFEFAIRKDAIKLGRVQEMFKKKREIDNKKKLFDTNEGKEGQKLAVDDLVNLGEVVGEEGTSKGRGRGRGRKKKRDVEDVESDMPNGGINSKERTPGADESGEERASKRAKSDLG
ncbi:uncharacterized protein Z519_02589 [Cladophialophora bantiana CBS 173.52]|uniref:Transcription initiation factor TFIID subunit 13 n=1 Tax=Cladophialophora bantiana (strain ATCC 10958 / CBS 173.52 / CDC B-1940 / NIH 8579) TaxID=1442370 RepID=A0A0D2GFP2_CLAB1|nr:uncharacterized protein Z519_02589 [Cladophialophora bantiana CBS 173.52]KIW97197.1 hypothetical protein Z519_02589 [Cladophialophora bantiana CBS 173.52]